MPNRHLVGFILALLIAVVSVSSVGAQAPECRFTPGITGYGIMVGAAHSKLSAEGARTELRTASMLSGFVVFGFAPHYGLQAELSYMERGTPSVRLDYLQLAVLARAGGISTSGDPNRIIMPLLLAGLGVSHCVSGHSTNDPGTADVSAIFGFGIDFRVGIRSRLSIGFRYDFGLLDQVRSGYSYVHQASSAFQKNRSTIYSVGFSF